MSTFVIPEDLQTLNLGKNEITAIPANLFSGDALQLTTLKLDKNKISSLSEGDFRGLRKLKSLDLSSNQISSLDSLAFRGLDKLTELLLYENMIQILPPRVFNGLGELTSLGLGINRIWQLPEGVFNGVSKLTHLALFRNNISSLPRGVFRHLASLQWLNLADINLTSLRGDEFHGLADLQVLALGRNKIQHLPRNLLVGLTKLFGLFLERNSLQSIHVDLFQSFRGLPTANFTLLNLMDNNLRSLPKEIFRGFRPPLTVLVGNPWDCGVDICFSWLTQSVIDAWQQPFYTENVRTATLPVCASPNSLASANTTLSEMPEICKAPCPAIMAPANGSISAGNSTYGTTRMYRCNAGFVISGSNTTQCQLDKTWSSPQPTCVQADSNVDRGHSKSGGQACATVLVSVNIGFLMLAVAIFKF